MRDINLDFKDIMVNSKNILFIQDIDGVCKLLEDKSFQVNLKSLVS